MRIRTLVRHGREGFRNLFRNGWMTFASISAVAVTLLILGVGMILSMNAQAILGNIENQVQINAFVATDAPQTQVAAIGRSISKLPGVAKVTFVPKAVALERMKKLLKSDAGLIQGLGNPLPDEYVVQAKAPRETAQVARAVGRIQGIEKVEYGQSFIGRLFTVVSMVRDAAVVLIVGLLLLGMFLISNTIKITIFARRREIEIMKLVGATDGFIRGPFFVEGTLMGMAGAILPSFVLYAAYNGLTANVKLFPPFSLLSTGYVFTRVNGVLFACGLFIGLWGSMVSMRKFLRI